MFCRYSSEPALPPPNWPAAPTGIASSLVDDLLVLRIPLSRVARRTAALKVLAAIKQEMGR